MTWPIVQRKIKFTVKKYYHSISDHCLENYEVDTCKSSVLKEMCFLIWQLKVVRIKWKNEGNQIYLLKKSVSLKKIIDDCAINKILQIHIFKNFKG